MNQTRILQKALPKPKKPSLGSQPCKRPRKQDRSVRGCLDQNRGTDYLKGRENQAKLTRQKLRNQTDDQKGTDGRDFNP